MTAFRLRPRDCGGRLLLVAMWTLVTPLGTLAQPPQMPFSTGLEFLEPVKYQGIPLAAPSYAGPLPASVLLDPLPPVGDQGRQGSCVAWAVAYALKTYQENQERHWGVTPPKHAFSPSFVYNQIKHSSTCNAGTYYADALNLLTRDGAALLENFPYDQGRCDQVPSATVRQSATSFRIASWRRVNTLDEVEVKTHLASGFPVLIGMPVDEAFMRLVAGSIYQGLQGPSLGGHAMVAVGYDDSKGAFRLINSWGTSWADGGFGWISYTGFRDVVREGYVVQDIVATTPGTTATASLELETIMFAEVPLGVRSVPKGTANHHCSANCQGEPTRTNYRLELKASQGAVLRNPKLRCTAGPCHGWNAVLRVALEELGTKAVASWDVWSEPTTWELSAEEYRIAESSRFVRHLPSDAQFAVNGLAGAPPPQVRGKLSNGDTFAFAVDGKAPGGYIRLVRSEVNGPDTVYYYEIAAP